MKQILFNKSRLVLTWLSVSFLPGIMFLEACTKEPASGTPVPAGKARTIQFSLFTSEDLSAYKDSITFTLYIRNIHERKNIWDSVFKTRTIHEIPSFANRILVEKIIPESDTSLLIAGFNYYISNVGVSWFADTCSKSTAFKKIELNFR